MQKQEERAEKDAAVAVEPEGVSLCALEGCDNPLPEPVVDEHGRRKGGRPSSYCCKGHADAASRSRRTAQNAVIIDPLLEVRRITETFASATQPLIDAVSDIQARLQTAEQGALAQVRDAEEQVRTAKAETEEATKLAERAEKARAQALKQSQEDRSKREAAEKTAHRAHQEAEQAKKEAWARTADHERARGAAEAAQKAALQAQAELMEALRESRTQLEDSRKRHNELQHAYQSLQEQLSDAKTECTVTLDRLHSAEKQRAAAEESAAYMRRELADLRAVETSLRTELTDSRELLATERTARQLAQAQAESAAQNLVVVRKDLEQAHSRLDQALALPRPPEIPVVQDHQPS